MLSWIMANLATLVISALLLLVLALIGRNLYRKKRRGGSCCGGSCGACPMSGCCHEPK